MCVWAGGVTRDMCCGMCVWRSLRVCVSGCGCVCVWIVRGCVRQRCGQFPGTPRFSHACNCG